MTSQIEPETFSSNPLDTDSIISVKKLSNYGTFYIPSYQRGFRWCRQQIKELMDDLYDFTGRNNRQPIYCLHYAVLKKIAEGEYSVIDGQQRITALWLLSLVYYSFSRDKKSGPPLNYRLNYDGKIPYTQLLKEILQIASRKSSEGFTREDVDSLKSNAYYSDFDSKNFVNLLEYVVFDYKRVEVNGDITETVKVLEQIFDNGFKDGKDITIITNFMSGDNEIEKFSDINAGKIPLTEAELIKAFLMQNIEDGEPIPHEWENIERQLNNNSFWAFFSNIDEHDDATRIDALFEIWYAEEKSNAKIVPSGAHELSRAVIALSQGNPQKTREIWNRVKKINDILHDWYSDYYYYHSIGLLLELKRSDKSKELIDLTKNIVIKYERTTKSLFKSWLKKEICSQKQLNPLCSIKDKNKYQLILPEDMSEKIISDHISLDSFNYEHGDLKEIRGILLLFNIALLSNSQNEYERFPFYLYKNGKWDIEHINPQSKGNGDNEGISIEKAREYYEPILGITGLEDKEFVELINDKLDIQGLSNLVLLDPTTNRGYHDAPFDKKRKIIINVMRNESSEEKVKEKEIILPGTRWAFLKEGSDDNLKTWSKNDRLSYISTISKHIYKFLYEQEKNVDWKG